MFKLTSKRILKSGLQNFFRNGFVSLSSILVITVTLFIITATLLLGGFLNYNIELIKNKVDVNVYFITTATEADVLSVKKSLESLPEVFSIEYISREQALINFKEKNKGKSLILQSLDELGSNPLGATLNIKAKDPSQYAGIAKYLDSMNDEILSQENLKIIDKVNYAQNKIIIDRLTTIVNSVNILGFWFGLIFIFISIIVTFNTIKLTIFMTRDEISIMRLVGASNTYVKGPFIISGLLCGIISVIVILIAFAIITFFTNHYYGTYFVGFNLFKYYITNFLQIFGIIFISGIILSSLSSYLAVQKYLKN
ncbi:MAG: permease-like cell division protein FtsX [bacterium]